MDIETFKTVMPIITFALGILSAPVVDFWRDKFQKKKNIKSLTEELKDEAKWLGDRIKKMSNSLDVLAKLKSKESPMPGPAKYVPRITTVHFIESVMDSNYVELSPEKRSTLKSMKVQIDAINEYSEKINNLSPSQEQIDELIKLKRSFIYTACCLRYCMQYFVEEECFEFIEDIGDKKAIELQLSALGLIATYDSLLNKTTYTYK